MTSTKLILALTLLLGATSVSLAQSRHYYGGPYSPGYGFYDSGAPYGYGSGYYYDDGYGSDAYRTQPSPGSGVESTR
jgi:hypothetical protein